MAEEPIKPEDDVVELTAEEQEVEQKARSQGWRPKDEYNGPPDRWVPAAEFLARGERELPILRERLRSMTDKVVNVERMLTEANTKIHDQSEVINEVRDMARTAQKRGYDSAMAELKTRERKAVAEADTVAYEQIQREKENLGAPPTVPPARTEPPKPPTPPTNGHAGPPNVTPEDTAIIQHWISENPWFNVDREMNVVATQLHGLLREQNPTEPLVDNLARVRARLVQMYPDKFENTARRRAAAVSSSSTPVAPRSKHKTISDLPADAKAILERYKRTIPNYTDEEYLKVYFGDDYNTPGA